MIWHGSKNKYQEAIYSKPIKVHAQNMMTIPNTLNSQDNWRDLHNHLISTILFQFDNE